MDDGDDDDGAVRTYKLWHASLQWVMEDLQWCDASLQVN